VPCIDGTFCTTNDACSGGVCVSRTCANARPANVAGRSPDASRSRSRASLARQGASSSQDDPTTRDKAEGSWGRASPPRSNPFGDPLTTDDYTLCISTRAVARLSLSSALRPDGGTHGRRLVLARRGTPPGAKGYVYRDSKIPAARRARKI
jgi:hypothetical protein